ncbi:hypothetical protein ACH4ND_31220 [Streptomyces sp. NPDC017179]|uniref:hypothetical protein n=1 Tax=Streptomyces sp. NPDC017179 TaxID=3364979 RepID=UPI0037895761
MLWLAPRAAVNLDGHNTFPTATRRRLPLWVRVRGQSETGPLTFRCLTRRSVP